MSIYEEDLNRTRLECKGNSEIRWGGIDMIDLNRTRLECKDQILNFQSIAYIHLNRTRLECKGGYRWDGKGA